jgi:hypothetical protein
MKRDEVIERGFDVRETGDELIRATRRALELSRKLRAQLTETRERLREERLQRELMRLTSLLEKAETDLGRLTETAPEQAGARVPSLNRWLETSG